MRLVDSPISRIGVASMDRAASSGPSELPYVTSRMMHHGIEVKAVGPAARGSKRRQPHGSPFEEPIRPYPIPAGCVGDCHADLRKSLPQVPFFARPGLPTRLKDLVGGERTAGLHEFSSRPECLFRRQRLLGRRLDSFG